MKKLLTFLLCVVFSLGVFGVVGCGNTVTLQQSTQKTYEQTQNSVSSGTTVQSVKLGGLVASTFSSGNRSSDEEPVFLSKTITATVLPETALNKKVDFEVLWEENATLKDENVSEYVTVEQKTDGALTATVKCFKNFGDDLIIVQCVTRDGGFTATCVVSYVGIASDIEVENVSGAELKYNETIGDYYEFHTNTEYVFNFSGVNALGKAKSDKIKPWNHGCNNSSGYYYFTTQTGSLLGGVYGHVDRDDDGNVSKINIDSEKFFAISYSRNEDDSLRVCITVKNVVFDSYDDNGKYLFGTKAENRVNMFLTSKTTDFPECRQANKEKINSHYFYVSAGWGHKDSLTGLIDIADVLSTIKFRIVSGVDSVSLSEQALEF